MTDHPAAIAERERVVAWLRAQVMEERRFNGLPLLTRYRAVSLIKGKANWFQLLGALIAAPWAAAAKDIAADSIERGNHAKVIEAGTGETPSGSTCESTVSAGNSPENSALHITQSGE